MELSTSKMKEKKDKIMWTWIKKNIKQVVLWSVIILIFIPLAVYCLHPFYGSGTMQLNK